MLSFPGTYIFDFPKLKCEVNVIELLKKEKP